MHRQMTGAAEFSGTITSGSYRLVRAVEGGRGRVHEARHDRIAGRFAVKLFGDVDARAFQRGAQQASALRHPGVAQVVDYGAVPGQAFVVMEWADGRSLASILAESGALPPDAVARLVDSIALGLQAAHRQGLSHGHLGPDRVLVLGPPGGGGADDETPGAEHTKILGFGLGPAGALEPGAAITEVTAFTAPEQQTSDASPLSDQFALAAIAYALLTGFAPDGDAARRRAPRSLREYDPTINVVIDEVVRRALSFDPHARWPDVYSFATRLREAVDSEGALEERTRLAPLPLTVTKTGDDPTRIELPPVIASVDVDLRTPAPARRELPVIATSRGADTSRAVARRNASRGVASRGALANGDGLAVYDAGAAERPRTELPLTQLPVQGDLSMNQPPIRPHSYPGSGHLPPEMAPRQTRGQAPPHYGIRPTPTFSFTDDPAPGPLYKPRRRRSGGGLGLALVVLAAGAGGYFSVQSRVWQEAEPLVARAKVLLRSLRTLAPGASPEPAAPVAAPSAPAVAPAATAAAAPASAPPAAAPTPVAAAPSAVPPAAAPVRPEVVPIAPAPVVAKAAPKPAHHASRPHHARVQRAAKPGGPKPFTDEDATEEALLAPSGR
jgi:serine/threonine protein kinase